jgi:hypothetical protein
MRRFVGAALAGLAAALAVLAAIAAACIPDALIVRGGAVADVERPDAADAALEAPVTCDAQFAVDPSNCGACGHSCLGGACEAGACRPIALAAGVGQGLALDAKNVYWTDPEAGAVYQCPHAGCGGAPMALGTGINAPNTVAVNATTVFWSNHANPDVIDGTSIGAPDAYAPICTLPQMGFVGRLAVQGGSIYFSNETSGAVLACAISNCMPAPIMTGGKDPLGVAVDPGHVYWTDYAAGSVGVCPIDGCDGGPGLLASGESGPRTIVSDSTAVYWSDDADSGAVRSCAVLGCDGGARTIAAGQAQPQGVAVDGTSAYWTNTGDGTVWKATLSGAGPVRLASGQTGAWAIAVDPAAIYWTNNAPGAPGAVMKLAK